MNVLIKARDNLYDTITIVETDNGYEIINRGKLMSRWPTLAQASIERERAVETLVQMQILRRHVPR